MRKKNDTKREKKNANFKGKKIDISSWFFSFPFPWSWSGFEIIHLRLIS